VGIDTTNITMIAGMKCAGDFTYSSFSMYVA